MDLKITPSGQTIVKPTALGPGANTDTKLLIYGLFQKGRVLAQDGDPVVSDSVRLSDPQATEPRGNSGKPGVTVRPPPAAHGAVSRTATHKRLLTKYTISVSQNH